MLVQGKKLQGIADVKDLTDREKGLRLVIEVKNGFHPEALLEQLYKQTPMEDSFGINAVALVDGQPRTLGLKEMLEVFLEHRFDVVRRRSAFRRAQGRRPAAPRRRPADRDPRHRRGDPADPRPATTPPAAQERLIAVFDLTEIAGQLHPRHAAAPADEVLPDRAGEGAGRAASATIEELDAILADDDAAPEGRLRRAGRGGQDLRHPAPHRPAGVGRHRRSPRPRCRSRSPTTRASSTCPPPGCWPAPATTSRPASGGGRANHDVVVSAVRDHRPRRGRRAHLAPAGWSSSACSTCRRCPAPPTTPTCRAALPVSEFLSLEPGERALALCRARRRRARARARHPRRAW